MSHANRRLFGLRGGADFRIRAQAQDAVDIYVYDEISMWGINAKDFVQALQMVDAPIINLHINSPGGDVFDGIAITNALRQHSAKVITHIDGIAASIASIIALAGDEVRIADNAFFMIHDPWAFAIGTSADMRKVADMLDKVSGSLVTEYMRASGKTSAEVQDLMSAETWYTAQEAVDAGFADMVVETVDAKAAFDLSLFQHAPAALATQRDAEPTLRSTERALRDAGYTRKEAVRLAALVTDHRQRDAGGGTADMLAGLDNFAESIIRSTHKK